MGKLINFKKRKRKTAVSSPGYRSVRLSESPGASRTGASRTRRKSAGLGRSRRYGRLVGFMRRNIKILAIGGIVLVVAVLCLVLFLGGTNTVTSTQPTETVAAAEPDELPLGELSESDDPYASGDFDIDFSEFLTDEEREQQLLAQEGIRIGVTVGSLRPGEDETVINRLEEVWSAAKQQKEIYDVFYYNAYGKPNQQLQDIRSLINKEVDVIIAAFMDRESFEMVTVMAEKEGIPVVAYDAPVDRGYAINVVPDQDSWGSVYGQFMTQKLSAGNVMKIFDSADNQRSAARLSALDRALLPATQLAAMETVFAGLNTKTAKDAVENKLAVGTAIDGVIAEEGMAEAVLDAFIEARKLPKVMCGDLTVGFIKKWYLLKNGGIDVTPKAAAGEPTPAPVLFAAQPGEFVVCAQPSPTGGAALAFEIAVEMAKGRALITPGQTYRFTVKTLVTDADMATYYAKYKDYDDSYAVTESIADAILNSLLRPLPANAQ